MITADLNTNQGATTLKNHIRRTITAATPTELIDKALDIITKEAPGNDFFDLCSSVSFKTFAFGTREVIHYPGKYTVAGWMIRECDPQGDIRGEPYYHREASIIIPAHKVA